MIIKRVIITFLLGLFTLTAHAQEWMTNFNEAKQLSATTGKNIILVFQGSDWCGPCMKLDKNIWSTETFKAYAKEHFIMLQADFPRKRQNKLSKDLAKQNGMLFEKYNKAGFKGSIEVIGNQEIKLTVISLFWSFLLGSLALVNLPLQIS